MSKINVPGVDLKANYQSIKSEIDEAVERVITSCAFILGPDVAEFEKEFAEYIGGKHCVGCSNGTDALFLAMDALGIGEGHEVLVQANTYCATVFSISRTGATPVLVDIDPNTLMVDLKKLEAKITPKTKAILPVHLFGLCPNMDKLMEIAKKHKLFVIEDASQAHGCRWNGKTVGTFGDIAGFSLYPGKNLGAYGDAGVIATDSEEHQEKLKMLRHMGQKKKYHHDIKGYNHRLDTLQAAILRVRLRHLEKWNEKRRQVAIKYTEGLKGVGDLVTPTYEEGCTPVWHLYVVQTSKRDELLKHLNDNGVGAQIHYPIPIHEMASYPELAGQADELKVSSEKAKKILSIPIYPDITDEQVQYVIDTVKSFFK